MKARHARLAQLCFWLVLLVMVIPVRATLAADGEPAPEALGRSTAVALNYCRAAFHRIREYPSKRVLLEEQDNVLNNLNLNQIADEEVVRLYSSVLDEIAQVQIADKEKHVIRDNYRHSLIRHFAVSGFNLGTHLAAQEYLSAVKTGARSWWDYRAMTLQRDTESWRIDRVRMEALVNKSSLFLDTFWKLARKRSIPDNWLIRNRDLDELEKAMREQDLEVRLRVLKRMEYFMECYPPYWYYVGRTQQALGQLFAAAETYTRLLEMGDGHFRKDEMLAAGLANLSVIQDYLQQPSAHITAQEALLRSTDVWEVNLMCARVLERHSRIDEAEDAILRNLDVGLEREQSRVCLLSLYYRSGNVEKVAAMLDEAEVVRAVPADVLLRCAAILPPERVPRKVIVTLCESVYGYFDGSRGGREFVLRAGRNWDFEATTISAIFGEQKFGRLRRAEIAGTYEIRLQRVADSVEMTTYRADANLVLVQLQYPDGSEIRLAMQQVSGAAPELPANGADPAGMLIAVLKLRRNVLQLTAATVGERTLILRPQAAGIVAPAPGSEAAEPPSSPPVLEQPPTPTAEPEPLPADVPPPTLQAPEPGSNKSTEGSTSSLEQTLTVPPPSAGSSQPIPAQ
ncbi:MAG: hypothetical protein WD648_12430 [Planctomycetaceae bacterium]